MTDIDGHAHVGSTFVRRHQGKPAKAYIEYSMEDTDAAWPDWLDPVDPYMTPIPKKAPVDNDPPKSTPTVDDQHFEGQQSHERDTEVIFVGSREVEPDVEMIEPSTMPPMVERTRDPYNMLNALKSCMEGYFTRSKRTKQVTIDFLERMLSHVEQIKIEMAEYSGLAAYWKCKYEEDEQRWSREVTELQRIIAERDTGYARIADEAISRLQGHELQAGELKARVQECETAVQESMLRAHEGKARADESEARAQQSEAKAQESESKAQESEVKVREREVAICRLWRTLRRASSVLAALAPPRQHEQTSTAY